MIIDAFTYSGELELLKLRLQHLKHQVDLHILIEAATTFRSTAKPIWWHQHQDLVDSSRVHFVEAQLTGNDPWQREYQQRNTLTPQLLNSLAGPDDIVFISDVDEIPESLTDAAQYLDQYSSVEFTADCYYYAFNLKSQERTETTKGCRVRDFVDGQTLRRHQENSLMLQTKALKAWHFTYIMSDQQIQQKIKSFAHAELDQARYTDLLNIAARRQTLQDPFDRGQLSRVSLDTLPPLIEQQQNYYLQQGLLVLE